jgi:hypothetical protein
MHLAAGTDTTTNHFLSSTASMSRKVFIRARITIEIDDDRPDPQGDFLYWVLSIVEPFGGDPIEGGFVDPRVVRHYSIARRQLTPSWIEHRAREQLKP